MKKIILVLLLLGLIGGYIGFKMYNKPFANLQTKAADFSLPPSALLAAFAEDEVKANATYLDKTIELKGTIKNITTENDATRITLDAGNPLGAVICEMDGQNDFALEQLKTGEEIILRGVCSGYLMDVILIRCIKI